MGGRTHSLFGFLCMLVVGAYLVTPQPARAATYEEPRLACALFGFVLKPFGVCGRDSTQTPKASSLLVNNRSFDIRSVVEQGVVAGASSTAGTNLLSTGGGLSRAETQRLAAEVFEENQLASLRQSALMTALAMYANREGERELKTEILDEVYRLREALSTTIGNARYDLRSGGGGGGSSVDVAINGTLTSPTVNGTITLSDLTPSTLLFTNSAGVMSGVSALSVTDAGELLIGTTSAQERLTIDGAIYLADNTPTTTDNRLYSIGGSLYWNGSVLAASSSANWSTGGGSVFRPTGSVGIGTSSPFATLSVVGDIALTGGLYDSSATRGTNGMVLQTTGTGVNWVATSSLGLAANLSGSSIEELSDVAAMTQAYGDLLFWNGSAWANLATTSLGLTTDNVSEGSNLFYTDARVATYISASTTILNTSSESGLESFLSGVSNVFTNNDVIGDANIADTITASNYLLLSDWYATTTDAIAEGISNLYFTNGRSDARFVLNFAGTTTDGLSEGSSNLYFTNARSDARFATNFAATNTDALSEGLTNLYFTNARSDARFAINLAGTTTDALTEGASNLYYTDARVASYILGSSTVSRLGQSITESELDITGSPTNGYLLQASSSASGGLAWVATSTLGITGGGGASSFTALSDTPGSYGTGDIFYASSPSAIATLNPGSDGQVLKISGGVPVWGADLGGSGGGGAWATSSDNLLVYPVDPSDVVVVGASGTSSTGYDFEVAGNALVTGTASSSNLTVSNTLDVNGRLTIGTAAALDATRRINLVDAVGVSNTTYSIFNNPRISGSLSGSRTGYGSYNLLEADAVVEGLSDYTAVAVYGEVQVDGTSSVGSSRAGQFIVDYNSSTGIGDNAYTLSSTLEVASGATVSNGYGYFSDLNNQGTIQNYYGIFLQDVVEGSMTNAYAFWTNSGDMVLDGDGDGIAGGNDIGTDLFLGEGQDAALWYDGTNLNINPRVFGTGNTIFTNGRVGVGTSTPYATLSVAGDIALSGGLYDSTGTRGSNGQLLGSNGTNAVWISTSTLAINTDDLVEGSGNLFFTNARSDTRFAANLAGTTTDALAEGSTNLYFTLDNFASALAGTTSDALAEGSVNRYFTDARFDSALAGTSSVDSITTLRNLATVGTIASGTWEGATVTPAYGGTGQSTYAVGDILYADGVTSLNRLAAGSEGTVLKISGGAPVWGSDLSGDTSIWATSTNGLFVSPTDPNDIVVIGATATSANGFLLEVDGNALVSGIQSTAATTTRLTVASDSVTDLTGDGLRVLAGGLAVDCAALEGSGIQCSGDNFALDFSEFNTDSIVEGSTNFWGRWGDNFGKLYYNPSGADYVGIGDTDPDYTLEVAASNGSGYFALSSTAAGDGDVFEVDSSGNVGIGTNNPGDRLEVAGGNLLLGNTQSIRWRNNASTPNTIMAYNSSNDLEIGSGILGNLELYGQSNILFNIDNEEYLRLSSTGAFGVGDQSPDMRLEISGTSTAGRFGISDILDGDVFIVTNAGDIGIGTTSPGDRLQVAGGNILLDNTQSIRWKNTAGTPNTLLAYSSSNDLEIGSGVGNNLELFGQNNILFYNDTDEFMRLAGDGSVGIGDQSPDFRLEVSATSSAGRFGITQTLDGDIFVVTNDGNVGIGSSTPQRALSVEGDVIFTGALRDNSDSAGVSGYVLQTTGTGYQWVATSSLGLTAGTLAISDLSDADTTGASAGNILVYNGSTWEDFATSTFLMESELSSEAELEALIADVANIFTNNDTIGDANVADDITASNYLLLSDWYATTTDAIAEGSTNLYFTNARSDTRFALNLAGTTTDALIEGASNLYYTDARVASYILGSTSISRLGQSIDLGVEVAGTLLATNGGTGLSSITDGELLIGGPGNTFTQVATSSLGLRESLFTDGGASTYLSSLTDNLAIGTSTSNSRLSLQSSGTDDILNLFETGGQEVFTVLENGNVGIGSSTPSERLTVAGNIAIDDTTSLVSGIFLNGQGALVSSTTLESYWLAGAYPTGGIAPTAFSSIAIGTEALSLGSNTGPYNIAIGDRVLRDNTAGTRNVSLGAYSMVLNTTGTHNTAVGTVALQNNATGSRNVAVGDSALFSNTGGSLNTAVGVSALNGNTTGDRNTAIGLNALRTNISGSFNTAIGEDTMVQNTTGEANIAIGSDALFYNATGSFNVAIGSAAMQGTGVETYGERNIALGFKSLYENISGAFNIAIGDDALLDNIDGSSNLALGDDALLSNTSGDNNIAIGSLAGDSLTTGSNNIIIGYDVEAPSNTADNQLNIGNLLFATGLNGTGTTLSSGNVGIGTTSPFTKLSVAGDGYFAGNLTATGSVQFTGLTDGLLLADSLGNLTAVSTSSLGLPSGTVTSVAASVPTGWTITGSPITESGTLAFDYDTGYGAVLTASSSAWESFYQTPSSRITDGTALTWTGNTLDLDINGLGTNPGFGTGDFLVYYDDGGNTYKVSYDSLPGAGGGLTSLNGEGAATQSFATSSDTNITLAISSSGGVHTFTPGWTGTLAATRGGTGLSSITDGELLIGGPGNTFTQVATSSLNINTDDLVEGTNLFYTDARVASYINGSSSILSTNTEAGLESFLTDVTNILTNNDAIDPNQLSLAQGNVLVGDASNNAVATSSLFIAQSGNVGIGTVSPDSPFYINATSSGFYSSGMYSSIASTDDSRNAFGQRLTYVANPTGVSDEIYYGKYSLVLNSNGNLTGSNSQLVGSYAEARSVNSGDVNQAIGGAFKISSIDLGGGASNINSAYGVVVEEPFLLSSTIGAAAGIAIGEQADGSNNTSLLLGTLEIPDGNFSLYSSSTLDSYFAGNVGIGTTSTFTKFTVTGDAMITGRLYDNTYSAGINGMVLQSTGSGFNWVATSSLGIGQTISGTEGYALTFNSSGNQVATSSLRFAQNGDIGVGGAPSDKFQVTYAGTSRGISIVGARPVFVLDDTQGVSEDNFSIANGGNFVAFRDETDDVDIMALSLVDNQGNVGIGTTTDLLARLGIQTSGSDDILNLFETGGNEVFTVLENGNVGIGTSSPASKLAIDNGNIVVRNDGVNATDYFVADNTSFTESLRLGGLLNRPTAGNFQGLINGDAGLVFDGFSSYLFGDNGVEIYGQATGNVGPSLVIENPFNTTGSAITVSQNTTISNGATGDINDILINPIISLTSSGNIIYRGIYYNASTTITNPNVTHRAIETVTGDVLFGSTNGNLLVGTTTRSARLSLQSTGTDDILNLFETGGEEVFTVLENGNVGIGNTSRELQSLLQVTGNLVPGEITISNSTAVVSAGEELGKLSFYSNDISGSGTGTKAYIAAEENDSGVGRSYDLTFGTALLGTLTEQMRITKNGNVGIGTSSPASMLDVWGDLRVGTSSTPTLFADSSSQKVSLGTTNPSAFFQVSIDENIDNTPDLAWLVDENDNGFRFFDEGSSNNHMYPVFQMNSLGGAHKNEIRAVMADGSTIGETGLVLNARNQFGNALNGANVLQVQNDGTALMTVNSDGNIGIGTTTPFAKLSVSGDGYFAGNLTATGTLNIAGLTTLANATATAVTITGRLYDNSDSAGTNGMVLQSTGSGFNWVGTSSLGFREAITGTEGYTLTFDSAGTQVATSSLFISNNGRVGIGTTTPGTTLPTGMRNTNGRAKVLEIYSDGTFDDSGLLIRRTGDSSGLDIWQSNGVAYLDSRGSASVLSNGFTFRTATNGSPFEALRILQNGYTGIGTTTQRSRLAVQTVGGEDILNLFESGGSEVFTVLENGNVGIGTSSPNSILNVMGDSPVLGLYGAGNDQSVSLRLRGYESGALDYGWDLVYEDDTTNNFSINRVNNGVSTTVLAIDRGTGNVVLNTADFKVDDITPQVLFGQGTGTVDTRFFFDGDTDGSVPLVTAQANDVNAQFRMTARGGENDSFFSVSSDGVSDIWSFGFDDDDNDSFKISQGTGLGTSDVLTLTTGNNIGIGTTTPQGRLSLENSGVDGDGVLGIDSYYSIDNATDAAVQYANQSYILANNTATTTIVGSILRLEDDTTFGNNVQGLQVQTNRGGNTLGENTAIAGFGRTFGVKGVTEGDAGSVVAPAGVYAETRGSTLGNALRAYSGDITTSDLVEFFQDSSAFSGSGLVMDFANSGGSFSGNFLDLKSGGTTLFLVDNTGALAVGTSSTAAKLSVRSSGTDDILNLFETDGSEVLTVLESGNAGIQNAAPVVALHVGSSSISDSTSLLRLEDTNSTCSFNADTGTPSCGSDLTLKKDVEVIESELARLIELEPSSWLWKTDDSGAERKFGFIAQDVEQQFPELVTESLWVDGTQRKFLNQGGLMPYVVGAVKEQQETLEELLVTGSSTRGTSSPFYRVFDGEEDTVWEKLVSLAQGFGDGILELTGLQTVELYARDITAENINTQTLCIGETCVTENELKALLDDAGINPSTGSNADSSSDESNTDDPAVGDVTTSDEEDTTTDAGADSAETGADAAPVTTSDDESSTETEDETGVGGTTDDVEATDTEILENEEAETGNDTNEGETTEEAGASAAESDDTTTTEDTPESEPEVVEEETISEETTTEETEPVVEEVEPETETEPEPATQPAAGTETTTVE